MNTQALQLLGFIACLKSEYLHTSTKQAAADNVLAYEKKKEVEQAVSELEEGRNNGEWAPALITLVNSPSLE